MATVGVAYCFYVMGNSGNDGLMRWQPPFPAEFNTHIFYTSNRITSVIANAFDGVHLLANANAMEALSAKKAVRLPVGSFPAVNNVAD